jgi:hypothetical protein
MFVIGTYRNLQSVHILDSDNAWSYIVGLYDLQFNVIRKVTSLDLSIVTITRVYV